MIKFGYERLILTSHGKFLAAAMIVEQFAPTPEMKLNTEYPYLVRTVDGHEVWQAPAEGFTEVEVVQALRATRIVVAAIIMALPV